MTNTESLTRPRPVERTVTLHFGAIRRGFAFLDEGNVSEELQRIVAGRTYPLIAADVLRPRLIIDIGAHVGAATVTFAHAYPGVPVRAYEPSAGSFALLARNTAGLSGVTVKHCGLLDESGRRTLHQGENHSMENTIVRIGENGETIEVRPAREELADITDGPGVVLKIDTEGCEVPILRDLSRLLDNVDLIYLEYHSDADRREIDKLLGERFVLATARAERPHLGELQSLSTRLAARIPEIATP